MLKMFKQKIEGKSSQDSQHGGVIAPTVARSTTSSAPSLPTDDHPSMKQIMLGIEPPKDHLHESNLRKLIVDLSNALTVDAAFATLDRLSKTNGQNEYYANNDFLTYLRKHIDNYLNPRCKAPSMNQVMLGIELPKDHPYETNLRKLIVDLSNAPTVNAAFATLDRLSKTNGKNEYLANNNFVAYLRNHITTYIDTVNRQQEEVQHTAWKPARIGIK